MRFSAALFFALSLLAAAPRAAAQESPVTAPALTLPQLCKALAASSPELRKEEAALLKARAGYREQLAFLSPTLVFTLPAGFSYTPLYSFYYDSSSSATIANSSAWDFSPTLSLTQALPTAGTLDLSVKNTLTVIDLGDPVNPFFDPFIPDTAFTDDLTVSLSLRQPIFFENAFAASLTIIEETYRLAQARFLLARNGLAVQAARDYFGLVRLQRAARLAELALANARLSCEDARKKLASGTVSRLIALKEESHLKKAELDRFDAAAAFRDERARVVSVYGLEPGLAVAEEAGPLALPALPGADEIRSRALAGNPEVVMGRFELETKKARIVTTKCENAHTLTLGSNLVLDSAYNYSTDLWEALADPFDGSSNPRLSFTFKLSFKLLDGGAAEERARQAASDADMSAFALEGKTIDLAGKIEAGLSRLERARLNADYAAASLAAAAQEFEAAGRDLALGQIARLDLDRLELAFRTAGLEDQCARSEGDLARLELFALLGDDLFALLTGGKP